MDFLRTKRAKSIIGYRTKDKVDSDPQGLIADAKKMARWMNDRGRALAKAGVPKNASVGRHWKPVRISSIKDTDDAERVIARARRMAMNPLTDIRNYNRLIKEAEKEFGAGRRWKIIADPNDPRNPKAVPYGTKGKNGLPTTPYTDMRDLLSEFWDWFETIGQFYLDSKQEAPLLLEEALDLGLDPIDHAEDYIQSLGEITWKQYLDQYEDLFSMKRASKYL